MTRQRDGVQVAEFTGDSKRVLVRMPSILHQRLAQLAKKNQQSLNLQIVNLLNNLVSGGNTAPIKLKSDPNGVTGKEISDFRKLHSLTQKDFANLMEVPPETISRWENNHQQMSSPYKKSFRNLQREYR